MSEYDDVEVRLSPYMLLDMAADIFQEMIDKAKEHGDWKEVIGQPRADDIEAFMVEAEYMDAPPGYGDDEDDEDEAD